ncbi:MAG: NYN domain-containing protein [Candidatus Promineifilaceae bacterium]|nr:NYN domain-containing protein [Candidatus Promineifilaceae bacterium]
MQNDVAIFLDLDNVVIGATEAGLSFDVNLILDQIRAVTSGRIVLREAYGDWRQRANLTKQLAAAGFELQSTVRLTNASKNLADMQLVVDAMSTLVDGHQYRTYVLVTGDRDFAPLVQALRKRGKQVIGLGVRHTSSQSLVRLCDRYIYYDELKASDEEMASDQVAELLGRAMGQLLQEESRVPASLLKQRLQSLSRGAFGRTPQGRRSFRKVLEGYPGLVALEQDGTTLYVTQPGRRSSSNEKVSGEASSEGSGEVSSEVSAEASAAASARRALTDGDLNGLIRRAIGELLDDSRRVRASLFKQRLQELSQGAFDEGYQGARSFRRFLERYPALLQTDQEGSTLYVRAAAEAAAPTDESPPASKTNGQAPLSDKAAAELLDAALETLTAEQPRVRASLLKQEMQEAGPGGFDETQLGYGSFRAFLDAHPRLADVQQKGTTLLVSRPEAPEATEPLFSRYRTALKKRGLRVVPGPIRLRVLRDLADLLEQRQSLAWRQIIGRLSDHYTEQEIDDISKSYINDTLRIARRAAVIGVQEGGSLAEAAVRLQLPPERRFQEAVMQVDSAYLAEIQALDLPFDVEQAALALYDDLGRARYLKILRERFAAAPAIPPA